MFSHIVIFWTDPKNPVAADELIAGVVKYLKPIPGDAFAITTESGDMQIGFPTEGGRGSLVSGSPRSGSSAAIAAPRAPVSPDLIV